MRKITTMKQAMAFSFKQKLWKYPGQAGWHFITLPKALSKKIRSIHGTSEKSWGRLPTMATIGQTTWKTAVWYDTKHQAYLLPVKSVIRKKEGLVTNKVVQTKIEFDVGEWAHNL